MRSDVRFLTEELPNERLAVLSQGSGYANTTLPVPLLSFHLRIRSCWNETVAYLFICLCLLFFPKASRPRLWEASQQIRPSGRRFPRVVVFVVVVVSTPILFNVLKQ